MRDCYYIYNKKKKYFRTRIITELIYLYYNLNDSDIVSE